MPFVADQVSAVAARCSGDGPPVMADDQHGVMTARLETEIGGGSDQGLTTNRFKLLGRTKAPGAACRQYDRENCVRHSISGVLRG